MTGATGLPPYVFRIPRAVRRATLVPPEYAHGTAEGYDAYACLCDRCRAFGRDRRRSAYNPQKERARTARRAAVRVLRAS